MNETKLTSATFISDVHLGIQAPDIEKSKLKDLIRTIEKAEETTDALFLVGDIFDYWFEYKEVIPKGYTRLFGLLSNLTDSGFPITYFSGNHDFWLGTYFREEMGIQTRTDALRIEINGKLFHIHHGDALGPGDIGYKFLKKILQQKWSSKLYLGLHPTWGIRLARWASGTSRVYTDDYTDYGDKERIIQYARQLAITDPYDYLVCGHRHIPKLLNVNDRSVYVNLGEWLHHRSFGIYDESGMTILQTNGKILFKE